MITTVHVGKFVGNFLLIVFFYTSSISLTFYNKWMSKKYKFPLSISMVHFVVVFLLAAVLRKIWELYKKEKRILLGWGIYLKKVVPSAIAGSLDIGFSNWSIMLSTVSLYTMAKSSTILFVMFFSIVLRLEKPSWLLFLVVLCISTGLFLFTFESKQFNLAGFSFAIVASVLAGIRWTTAQLVMQKKAIGLKNPIDAIYHIQPMMAVVMVMLAFSVEGKQLSNSKLLFHAPTIKIAITSILVVLLGAALAFVLTISEYLLVSHTSGITLSIAGIFKEVCTLTIAAEFGGDRWTMLNFIGLVVCMVGISIHVITKALKDAESSEELRDEGNNENVTVVPLLEYDEFDENDDNEEITLETSFDSR